MKPKFGEVWLADLGWAAKIRHVIIISRDDPEAADLSVCHILKNHPDMLQLGCHPRQCLGFFLRVGEVLSFKWTGQPYRAVSHRSVSER